MKIIKTLVAIATILCCSSFIKTKDEKSVLNDRNFISWSYVGKFYDPGISGYLYVWCDAHDYSVVKYGTFSMAESANYPATGSFDVNSRIVTGFTMYTSTKKTSTVAGTPFTGTIAY